MRNLKEIKEGWKLKYKQQWKHSYMQLAIALEESKKKNQYYNIREWQREGEKGNWSRGQKKKNSCWLQ